MKHLSSAVIFGLSIVLAALFLGNAYVNRNKIPGEISVTGLGNANFDSDLVVWEGRFTALDTDLKKAYLLLDQNKAMVNNYLADQELSSDELKFSAVQIQQKNKTLYAPNGTYMGEEFLGYELIQKVLIESKEVDKIEKISREITELLHQGVPFYSEAPRYYYTQLADLKIEMISKATEDARLRAEKIAENSGGKIGSLQTAKMGVFQITGQNSGEDYSWGGTYNTDSRKKTASITMKLNYSVK